MKKLTLNKKTIAQLDSPDKILGGAPATWTKPTEIAQSNFFVSGCAVEHTGTGCLERTDVQCGTWQPANLCFSDHYLC